MISMYKLERNLKVLRLDYKYTIDVKAKECMLRTEKGDYNYKSTKGIINELWRQFK